MERRLASFLFCDQHGYWFMDSHSYDQHCISAESTALNGLELRDGCEVFLTFDKAENLVRVELSERPLYDLYQSVTGEKFAPEYTKLIHEKLSHYDHRAIFIYRQDPVALVVEFTNSDAPYAVRSVTRVPLAELARLAHLKNGRRVVPIGLKK